MNARDYKIFRPNHYYHVYNRGNNKQQIFLDESDYKKFTTTLKIILGIHESPKNTRYKIVQFKSDQFEILSYCLMPNHFHFLIKQNSDIGIDKLILKLCTSYAKYFNKKYEKIGNVFQDTFKAKPVDNNTYCTYLSAYIHNNPDNPLNYPYSSLSTYLGYRDDELCNQKFILSFFKNNRTAYKNFVLSYNEKYESCIEDLKLD